MGIGSTRTFNPRWITLAFLPFAEGGEAPTGTVLSCLGMVMAMIASAWRVCQRVSATGYGWSSSVARAVWSR